MKFQHFLYVFLIFLLGISTLGVNTPNVDAQGCSSGGSGQNMPLSVLNPTNETLKIYLKDTNCNEQFIQDLNHGDIANIQTFDGQEFVFRKASDGSSFAQFTASERERAVVLSPLGSYNPTPVQSSCSGGANAPQTAAITLTVINNSNDPVLLNWIDYQCNEQLLWIVPGQDQFPQATFVGHDWVARFVDGSVAGQIVMSTADDTIIIDPPPGSNNNANNNNNSNNSNTNNNNNNANFPTMQSGCEVREVTEDMGLDRFYRKYCEYEGLLIVGSHRVDDAAFHQAWLYVANMLYNRLDIVEAMLDLDTYIIIMAEDEFLSQMPETADSDRDPADLDTFRNSINWGDEPLYAITGEENLLCSTLDEPWAGQSSLVFMLGDLIAEAMIRDGLYTNFDDDVDVALENARANGLWDNSFVVDSSGRYSHYGLQVYFNSAVDSVTSGPTDDIINTRSELEQYDPQLYNFIHSIFNTEPWTLECPSN